MHTKGSVHTTQKHRKKESNKQTHTTDLDKLHEHVDLVPVLERAEELQDERVRAGGQDGLLRVDVLGFGLEL
jgi:hypothetical protein